MSRILLVEDNEDLAFGLENNLEIEGYEVTVATTGEEAERLVREVHPGLVILDLMLPGMDGFEVLGRMRRRGLEAPVLILTARGEEVDKVRGLRLGADDYVTKPFGLLELLARVEALLRRTSPPAGRSRRRVHRFGAVEVRADTREVLLDERPVQLTPKELDLLLALLRRDGAVASREELLAEVWGYAPSVVNRTVDTHVAELRRKLERRPSSPVHILTVRKAGYRLDRSAGGRGTGGT
jgi:DNA-binding response OmpR family regulator